MSKATILLVLSFLGYLFCYAPFCHYSNASHLANPLNLLPISSLSCMLIMFIICGFSGWWRQVIFRENGKIHPAVWSSLFSAPILLGTPMSYALPGVSMLTMGVTMKAGSLGTAPVADYWNLEKIKRSSWVALALCVGALAVATVGEAITKKAAFGISVFGLGIIVAYVLGYLGRLRKMKGQKGSFNFWVVEHVLQPTIAFGVVCVAALFIPAVKDGFALWHRWDLWLIGAFSQGMGLFGGWLLLHKRESSFSMPLSRAGAILGNLIASLWGGKIIDVWGWGSVGLVTTAIVVLTLGEFEVFKLLLVRFRRPAL